MKNYTDSLIEEYNLEESYRAQPAASEADKLAAIEEYKNAAKLGYRDTEAFHKAYDDIIKADGLLDCFADDGELLNKGTYGRVKDADTEAKKVVKQFWVYTYSTMPSKFPPYKPAALKNKADYEKDKKIKGIEDTNKQISWKVEALENSIRTNINNTYKDILDEIERLTEESAKYHVTITKEKELVQNSNRFNELYEFSQFIKQLRFWNTDLPLSVEQLEIELETPIDVLTETWDTIESDTKQQIIDEFGEYIDEVLFLVKKQNKNKLERLNIFEQMGETKPKQSIDYYCRLTNGKLVKIPADPEEVCIEVLSETPVHVSIKDKPIPVATHYDYHDTGRCYVHDKDYYSYNSKELKEDERKKLRIPSQAEIDSYKGYFNSKKVKYTSIPDTNNYQDFPGFDTWVLDEYECDSSD